MSAHKKTREISYQEISQSLNNNISGADTLRSGELAQLAKIRKGKQKLQVRELKRVKKKYGSLDPRNERLIVKLKQNERLMRDLSRELERTETAVPGVDRKTWVVYGYVRNLQLEPLAGLTLGLFTKDSTLVDSIARVTTDQKGYFEFRYRNDKETETASVDSTNSGGRKTGTIRYQKTRNNLLYIHVMGKGRKRLHVDTSPLIPRTGAVDYRDIIITSDTSEMTGEKTRYLGNSNTRELHDLKNEKNKCGLKNICFDHKIHFNSREKAIAAGYDYCAYCFGKHMSKR